MTSPLPLHAQSHADDTAYRTTIDLAAACSHLDWPLVGGVAVHLQQRLLRIEDVPGSSWTASTTSGTSR